MKAGVEQQLQWRRDKVRELTIKGWTQREIAAELQIALSLVNNDLRHLRRRAKHNIQHYVDEYLPAEFQNCLESLNMIAREMWDLQTKDNRELLQARTLIKDCCAMKVDLLSSATVVDRAVKFVDNHRGLINDKIEDDSSKLIKNTG